MKIASPWNSRHFLLGALALPYICGVANAQTAEDAPAPAAEEAPAADEAPPPEERAPVEAEAPTPSADEVPNAEVAPAAEAQPPLGEQAPAAEAPPAEARNASPTEQPGPEAASAESDLVPAWEPEQMSKRPVDLDSMVFKPGSGLTAQSVDKSFKMSIGIRGQFLFEASKQSEADVWEDQFTIRRARLTLKGNVFGEHNKYKMELAVSPRDVGQTQNGVGTSPLLDLYFDFDHLRDLTVRVGQYKVPFNRERVISSGALDLVDRSITNAEFNLDRDVGVDLRSEDLFGLDLLRYYLGVYPGEGRNPTTSDEDFKWMYLGRFEVLPFGMFEDYVEADFERTGPRLSLGVSGAYLAGAHGDRGVLGAAPADGGTTDFVTANADAVFKWAGLFAMSEVYWRQGTRNPGDAVDDAGDPIPEAPTRDGIGFMAQAGYLLPRTAFEVSARYAGIRGRDVTGHDALSDNDEVVGGLGYYFAHHQLKLQADYARIGDFGGSDEVEDRFRLQLQAAY